MKDVSWSFSCMWDCMYLPKNVATQKKTSLVNCVLFSNATPPFVCLHLMSKQSLYFLSNIVSVQQVNGRLVGGRGLGRPLIPGLAVWSLALPAHMLKCPWARHWSPSCSWWIGQRLPWQLRCHRCVCVNRRPIEKRYICAIHLPLNVRPTMLTVDFNSNETVQELFVFSTYWEEFGWMFNQVKTFLFTQFHIQPLNKGSQPSPFFLRSQGKTCQKNT